MLRSFFLTALLALSPPMRFAGTAVEHDVECAKRLSIIFEAIQAYRRAHEDDVPRRLSGLCPGFLADSSLLICPHAQASGRYTPGFRNIWTNAPHESFGSYNWEFSSDSIPARLVGGKTDVTQHQVKTALAKSPIGEFVPIVRCLWVSDHALNLGFGGTVYPSPLYWEGQFVSSFPSPYTQPLLILRDQRAIKSRLPGRADPLPIHSIDLSDAANACLGDPWLVGRGVDRLPFSPEKATSVRSGEVVFEVRGIVQTGGAIRVEGETEGFGGPSYPEVSAWIRVDARCAKIHFLHATAFRALAGEVAGSYRIAAKSGATFQAPLRMGGEIACWRDDPAAVPLPAPWRGRIEELGGYALFHWTWQNPDPSDQITVIRLSAAPGSVASPFLLAVTVEPVP